MMKRLFLSFIFFLFLIHTGFLNAQSNGYLVIKNGTIIDGTGTDPVQKGVVVIQGNKIMAVGSLVDVKIPSGAKVIDVMGMTVLPGIIDSHVHTAYAPEIRRKLLEAGVTSICDLGSPIDKMNEFKLENFGQEPVARGLTAGPIVTSPGGLPDAVLKEDLNFEVETSAGVKKGIEYLIERGANVIKIFLHPTYKKEPCPMLNLEEIKAVVKEAHSRGKLVRAHITRLSVLDLAIEGGVDVVEHIPYSAEQKDIIKAAGESNPREAIFNVIHVPEYETKLPRMAEKNIIMVPTLERPYGKYFKFDKDTPQRIFAEAMLEVVNRFHKLGGTIALGTDYNYNSKKEFEIPVTEMEMMHEAGLTTMEVIEASTRHAAYVSGRGKDLGTLEKGKLADIIIVDGDPLKDLKVLNNVLVVIKDGKLCVNRFN
ncbi:MAG: amidohydrolase family protein [Candidatus Aminicenantaceae bacterium]